MICHVIRLFISTCVCLVLTVHGVRGDASEEMRKLQEEFYEFRMQRNPSSSTYNGMYKYNDIMESFDVSDFDIARNKTQAFIDTLKSINRYLLNIHEQVNYDILEDSLQTFLDGNLWAKYGALTPINFLGGIQLFGGPSIPSSSTRGDFENYIVRLHAVQKQVDEIKESCRMAISLNRTLHNVSMARVPEQIDGKIFNNTKESTYYSDIFVKKLNNSESVKNETVRENLRARGAVAVTAYINAFRDLKSFIVNNYMPKTRTQWGVYAWDPTHEYYKACLKWHLSFEMTPDDVHNLGLKEVGRINKAMMKIMRNLTFEGSVNEFFTGLEGDSRFYSNDTKKILDAFKDTVFNRIEHRLGDYFRNIPVVPLKIEADSYDGIAGGYSPASKTHPGTFAINLFRPLEVSFFEMMALSLHETNPGHHLQNSYSLKANLPGFRKNAILSFYNVPNWFPFYSAYQEGWGLYSEYLGVEMGLYKDDYEMMGRYSFEILRAVRLVVDTGLHYKGWTRDEAIQYLMNHTALEIGIAQNEIDRYITWPGQACAYKLGEIKIKELRQKAETELGQKFDIKDFHYLLLENGGMPMSVLETVVTQLIVETHATTRINGAEHRIPSTFTCTWTSLSIIAILRYSQNI